MAIEFTFGTVGSSAPRVNPGKKSSAASSASFADRPFVAWDGEGWTAHTDLLCGQRVGRPCLGKSCEHHYFLFGCSAGLSVSAESLSTKQCLDLMLLAAQKNPTAIHVGFAFDYDVNMILRDVKYLFMKQLKEKNWVQWRGYRIEHIPRKWFQVSAVIGSKKVVCRIQDVFSYFATSFVKALKKNRIGTSEEHAFIASGKDARGDFTTEQLETLVRPYWQMELRLLVDLVNDLRKSLYSADIFPTQWFGPGNVATYVFKRENIESHMNRDTPKEMLQAAAFAYAGGRFETFRAGFHDGPVYSADINSAYPYALSTMPDLKTGTWETLEGDTPCRLSLKGKNRLGLFYVSTAIKGNHVAVPYPKFHRLHGAVCWPRKTIGWVFLDEARMLARIPGTQFHKGYLYHDDGTNPFDWIPAMYEQRRRWKDEGNSAEKALKLCLNSCYGKFAQRIGWDEEKKEAPRWHQLLWAGATTSRARSMLFQGSLGVASMGGLIAVETDGIYSTKPFPDLINGAGTGLGQWEMTEYSGILFLQNGVYWLRNLDGEWEPPKSRGIPQAHMNLNDAFRSLRNKEPMHASQTRFQGYGMAVHRNQMDHWRKWQSESKSFVFGGSGKRIHVEHNCLSCREGAGYHESLHNLTAYQPENLESEKHSIPWESDLIPELKAELQIEERWEINVV